MRHWCAILLALAPLAAAGTQSSSVVKLPAPRTRGATSLEEALAQRRSVRAYANRQLTLADLSQLLWAAQGVTAPSGGRTAPSAGARYPLELSVVVGNVTDLPPGVYRYRPASHDLVRRMEGDRRSALAQAVGQSSPGMAAAVLVFAGVYERTTGRYGDRGVRFVHIEAGLAAQNACLTAAVAGLGAVVVGAFDDEQVSGVVGLGSDERPLLLLPVGWPRGSDR